MNSISDLRSAGEKAVARGVVVRCDLVVFVDGTPAGRRTMAAIRDLDEPVDLDVRIVEVPVDRADWKARNRAIDRCDSTYVAVVESGVSPAPRWLTDSVAVLREDPTLGMVSLDERDDIGYRIDVSADAFVCRRTAWDSIGGFDRALGREAHGLDLGWRTWLMGWRARSIAVAGSSLPPVVAADTADLEKICARLLKHPGSSTIDGPRGSKRSGSGPTRRTSQRRRRLADGVLSPLLRDAIAREAVAARLGAVLVSAGAGRLLHERRTVVVATAASLGHKMAGPGIRALHIAMSLNADHDVHLVTTARCEMEIDGLAAEAVDDGRFEELVQKADIVIFQGYVMVDRPWLARADAVVVVDIYDPLHLEQLEQGKDATPEGGRWRAIAGANDALNEQFRRGDYFLCASGKQRDFWLGQAAAVGRINQVLYDEDDSLTNRFRVVPFGIEDDPPQATGRAIRGRVDGIGLDDEVILWGGGIYNWFDPLTLIRAVDRLRHRRPKVRLYFLGTAHPEIPEMQMSVDARQLARDLQILDSHVFFNDGWVAFDDRAGYLLDADVAVSIHKQHVETEFSFRTRILDYLWAGRPIVATSGDSFAPLIVEHELGLVVEPDDVEGLESALDQLLDADDMRSAIAENCAALADDFRWAKVLESVVEICRDPVRAPDVACPDTVHVESRVTGSTTSLRSAWSRDLALVRTYAAEGGVPLLVDRVRSHVLAAAGDV